MSEPLDRREREKRAFDALFVSHLLRDRDITDLNDLPQLSESQRAAMNAVPSDIVDQLWNGEDTEVRPPCEEECDALQAEALQDYEQFAGANRADMDEETKKRLGEARKLALEAMRKQNKDTTNADS